MWPKTGQKCRDGNDRDRSTADYAAVVAEALVAELGKTHRAAKILMAWTGAGERTVKRWLAGSHGPRGDHLLVLMGRSDAVFEAVLVAVDRRDAALVARAIVARRSVEEVLGLVAQERSGLAPADAPAPGAGDFETLAAGNDRDHDRDRDREDDRDHDPDPRYRDRFGASARERQAWFLEALRGGRVVAAADIAARWRVSEKTSRRDIANLKERGLVQFVGPCRSGQYRATRR